MGSPSGTAAGAMPAIKFEWDDRGAAEQGASPLVYARGQGARKVRTSDIPFPRLVLARRGSFFRPRAPTPCVTSVPG
jgi:hypothetical protein